MILTRAELEKRLSPQDVAQLADLDGINVENDDFIDACLSDAESEVLAWVRSVGDVPDPAPEVLKRVVCDIARYNLYQRHLPEDHPVVVAYKQAIETLKGIASGRIAIPTKPNGVPTTAPLAYAPARVMTDSVLNGMGP